MAFIHSPEELLLVAKTKVIENIFFKKFLRSIKSEEVDRLIHKHYTAVQQLIDCTRCGNCCKKLDPGIESDEIPILAQAAQIPLQFFLHEHTATDGHARFLKQKPCLFLKDCKCSIYTQRPKACAGYPHLDQKDMKYKRSLWENYSICPIVYNVLEQVKKDLNYKGNAA